jgi:choline dehydrogenase-like flavoprotein
MRFFFHSISAANSGPYEIHESLTDVHKVSTAQQIISEQVDWQYKSEPMPTACLGLTGGRSNWPRGKLLGGSSVLNYMLYVRGNKNDYNQWESFGNPGWGYPEVLHYFKVIRKTEIRL